MDQDQRQTVISPNQRFNSNVRAFSPVHISEYDEIHDGSQESKSKSKKRNNSKILSQFKKQKNAMSPFLGSGKRNFNKNKTIKNKFTQKMKSPIFNKKIFPLLNNDHPSNLNQNTMISQKINKSRNRSKRKGAITIYPVRANRTAFRNLDHQYLTLNSPKMNITNKGNLFSILSFIMKAEDFNSK